jgi:hypothetical protein
MAYDMSRLDELPPDQRAALSLLVAQRKSYGEVAALLGIGEQAVRDRAHGALSALAPTQARQLTQPRRQEIGDYLLGQAGGVAEQLRTRTFLSASPPARAWALALAGELAPLAGGNLPEVPPPVAQTPQEPSPVEPGPPPIAHDARSSRLGGAIVLGAIVIAAIVAVVLLSKGGGSSSKHSNTTATTTSTSAKSSPVRATLALRSPNPSSRSIGVVYVLAEGNTRGIYIAAEHLAPSRSGTAYAIWLYNSPTSFRGVSVTKVGSSGRIQGGSLLPTNASEYHTILLTRESTPHPTHPGHVVLNGGFTLAG